MDLQLCVVAETDPNAHQVRLTVTGQLSESNHQLLLKAIRQARTLTVDAQALVNPTGAEQVQATAVDFLIWELEHHTGGSTRPVGIILPDSMTGPSRTGPATEAHTIWSG